jgi:hypothetical protein
MVSKICALSCGQSQIMMADFSASLKLSCFKSFDELKQYVYKEGMKHKHSLSILNPSDYQLLRIKKPEVAESEMLKTILWQEQASFSFPLNQLVIDYIECPTFLNEKRLYVIALEKRTLKKHYDNIVESGFQPIKITLPELIYANYIQKNYSFASTVIWLNLFEDNISLLAFHKGELFASLKLPQSILFSGAESLINALNIFYLSEVKLFSENPLWLFNGIVDKYTLAFHSLSGTKECLNNEKHALLYSALEKNNHSMFSHAYYGGILNE